MNLRDTLLCGWLPVNLKRRKKMKIHLNLTKDININLMNSFQNPPKHILFQNPPKHKL